MLLFSYGKDAIQRSPQTKMIATIWDSHEAYCWSVGMAYPDYANFMTCQHPSAKALSEKAYYHLTDALDSQLEHDICKPTTEPEAI